jgi:hypothetical protein
MARPQVKQDNGRGANFGVIQSAFEAYMPTLVAQPSQSDVAELCRLDCVTRRDRAPVETRDRIYAIAAEWDFDRDLLSEQSNACIQVLAELLRRDHERT